MEYSNNRVLLLICFLILLKATLYSQADQNITFTNINNTHGLPNNTVAAITKDDLGFIWLGTSDGLCRYEGPNEVQVFRANNPKIEGGLQSNKISSLFFDTKDNLWVGTSLGGLTKYHQPSGIWKTYRHDKNNASSISNDEILSITEDKNGRLWIGTEDGLNVYDHETESFISFRADPKNPNAINGKAILTVMEDDQGRIWAGTWAGGLNLLIPPMDGNIANAKFKKFLPSAELEAQHIWKIFQDKQNRYWIGTRGAGLFLMELPENANDNLENHDWLPNFHSYKASLNNDGITNHYLEDIFQDSKGNLWIGTVEGLSFISSKQLLTKNKKNGLSLKPQFTFQHFFHREDIPNTLSNNDIINIFEDNQGLIWIGTFNGASVYNWSVNQFDVFGIEGVDRIQNFYIDNKGTAWIANGNEGICKYDFKTKKKIPINEIPILSSFTSHLYSPNDRHLYVGTETGVSVVNMITNQTKNYEFPKEFINQFNSIVVRTILKDSENKIWVGSQQGLFVIDGSNETYKRYFHESDNPKSVSDNAINQVKEDSNGDIWITTYNGLNKVIKTPSGKIEFIRFKHDSSNPSNSIPSNKLSALEEVDGILYIGTNSGLCGYDLKKKTFISFDKNNIHSIESLEKTEDANLWAGTANGIVFFNTKTETFNKYEKEDGLSDVIFQSISSDRDKEGFIYFGSRNEITRFHPNNLRSNKIAPPVFITDIRTMSPESEEKSVATYQDKIILNHNDYFLSLNFTALNYNRPEKNTYAYKLNGFEENWNYSDSKIAAVYTNLDHGEYSFQVKAANNDGVWNEEGTSLTIVKKPALWETWLFRIACLVAIISISLFSVKHYTRTIKERNKKLQKYNKALNKEITQRKKAEKALQEREQHLRKSNQNLERSNKDLEQFAYIASHDLQEPLRVVGNFIGLLKRRYSKHFDEDAYQYIDFAIDGVSRMSEQIKSILTFSRVSQDQIEYQMTDLNDLIATNLHDLSQKIKEKNVQFEIDELPKIYCDKNLIKIVFNNLISNAIKFNDRKTPFINFSHHQNVKEGFWQFSIKDNGIGIHKDFQSKIFKIFNRLHKNNYEGTGIGLTLCQKIIHRHGGDIWVESEEGIGTTFYFTISMNQQAVLEENQYS